MMGIKEFCNMRTLQLAYTQKLGVGGENTMPWQPWHGSSNYKYIYVYTRVILSETESRTISELRNESINV